jgi:hypothetical protein
MKTRRNTEILIGYLRVHQPATVARMAAGSMMSSRDVSDATQYGVRHGVFERVRRAGANPGERVQYRLTGQTLPRNEAGLSAPSFDALLAAWGITCAALALPRDGRTRVVMFE